MQHALHVAAYYYQHGDRDLFYYWAHCSGVQLKNMPKRERVLSRIA